MSTAIFASRTILPAVAMLVCLPSIHDVFQAHFEDRPPFVLDNDRARAERNGFESVPCGDSSAAPRRLLCCFAMIGKVDAFLVQNGHLSTFKVEEIAGHFCSGVPQGQFARTLSIAESSSSIRHGCSIPKKVDR